MAGYAKPWTSYADQLQILQQRGMQVSDTAKALEYLERIGYYRLSGYWHVMRQWQRDAAGQRVVLDQFKPGTQFQDVVALYVFDKRLRLLVLDALERIEIALRVDLSYRLGQRGVCVPRPCELSPHLYSFGPVPYWAVKAHRMAEQA